MGWTEESSCCPQPQSGQSPGGQRLLRLCAWALGIADKATRPNTLQSACVAGWLYLNESIAFATLLFIYPGTCHVAGPPQILWLPTSLSTPRSLLFLPELSCQASLTLTFPLSDSNHISTYHVLLLNFITFLSINRKRALELHYATHSPTLPVLRLCLCMSISCASVCNPFEKCKLCLLLSAKVALTDA